MAPYGAPATLSVLGALLGEGCVMLRQELYMPPSDNPIPTAIRTVVPFRINMHEKAAQTCRFFMF